MFTLERALFVLVDVQARLTAVMAGRERLVERLVCLTRGMRALNVPIVWVEQLPAKMGPTIPELSALLDDRRPLEKACFSCADHAAFRQALDAAGRDQIVLAGIEAHVCIYQTARDLLAGRRDVVVAADAVSSRSRRDRTLALRRMEGLGAALVSVEMLLFELLRSAEHPAFRDILKLVK